MTPPLQDLVIIGAGGFGREVLDIVNALRDFRFVGFLDDTGGEADADALVRLGARVLGPVSMMPEVDALYVIGIGRGPARREISQAIGESRTPATIIHPSSKPGADTQVGPGSVITRGAHITTNVRLGNHVHINLNATVGHDSQIFDFVQINPGAHISGRVCLQEGVFIGTGAVVLEGLTIGQGATVGAGAVVTKDVPPGQTWVGVPARPIT